MNMKKWTTILIAVGFCMINTVAGANFSELKTGFEQPPAEARPWVYWFWMNGNITREGITADLEAMDRVGIGGALIMSVGNMPRGRVDFLTPEWRSMFAHAVKEAERLGIEVIMYNADGWTGSGGPWNTVENSMQVLTFSETPVKGGEPVRIQLRKPPHRMGYYQDIAAYAIPLHRDALPSPEITASEPNRNIDHVMDGDFDTLSILPKTPDKKPGWIQFTYEESVAVGSCTVWSPYGWLRYAKTEFQFSTDGVRWKTLDEEGTWREAGLTFTFSPVRARFYRLVLPGGADSKIAEIRLSPHERGEDWIAKAAFLRSHDDFHQNSERLEQAGVAVVDVSAHVSRDGLLIWDAPAGNWTILRMGHTTSGRGATPATPKGKGLEVDKMSKDALEIHFEALLGKLIADVGPLSGKTFMGTHVDSWEVFCQNWTASLPEAFKKRNGYDLGPWLPCTAGIIVESAEATEKFLWDYRKTLADMIAENYFGHLATLASGHDMQFSTEAYGNGNFDNLQAAGRSDIPMNEFWITADFGERIDYSARQAASAAHTYGKRIVAAEAFTAGDRFAKWHNHPFKLKPWGDRIYCRGSNRLILHRWAMQPWMDRWPGMTFNKYGIHFERTVTWFEQSAAWLEYLTRCQYLLQEGRFAADYAFFIGEGVPNGAWKPDYALAEGYNFDYCNDEIIYKMKVNDGRIVLPSGMQYSALVLPRSEQMTLRMLEKIESLVNGGAVVLAPKVEASPSLRDADKSGQLLAIADRLWGDRYDAGQPGSHRYGKGVIHWGKDIKTVLAETGIGPDVTVQGPGGNDIEWIHRASDDADWYFISSINDEAVDIELTFRMSNRRPQLWHPDTGRMEALCMWTPHEDTTTIPLHLDPCGSVFVMFPKKAASFDPVVSLTCDGKPVGEMAEMKVTDGIIKPSAPGTYELRFASGRTQTIVVSDVPASQTLDGRWQLSFPPQYSYGDRIPQTQTLDKLFSWTQHPDEKVKYFSGTAVYRQSFEAAPEISESGSPIYLDLGDVEVIAEVRVNGKDLGILWKPPFRVEVTDALVKGRNELEVRVTNLWVNRLVGDEKYPEVLKWRPDGMPAEWPDWVKDGGPVPDTGRVTFETWNFVNPGDKPLPSGLLGPVTLQTALH